jgi:hypothetical protein
MAALQAKIQNVLDEIRILILSAQVLITFQCYAAFEHGFADLARPLQLAALAGLVLSLLTLALLLTPVSFHRVIEEGRPTNAMHRFATRMMTPALVPFALALAIDLFIAARPTAGRAAAWTFGIGITLAAAFAWWGGELTARRHRTARHVTESKDNGDGDRDDDRDGDRDDDPRREGSGDDPGGDTRHRVQQVLTEARVVLPGAQAMFGFGFNAVLSEAFRSLPETSQQAHLAALVFVTLSIILLIAPAAYHRIVEKGENSEHFVGFAGKLVTAAMVPLAIGTSLDFFVVARKIVGSFAIALAGAIAMLLVFYGMWFGYTIAKRLLRDRELRRAR